LHLSLEEEIDQFQLEEEREEQGEPVIQVSYLEDELDRSSCIRSSGFIITRITSNLEEEEEEEEEEIPLERKKGLSLCELLMGRSKGSASKGAFGFQLPLFPPPSASPFALANLKKRKKDNEVVEKEELVPYNEGFLLRCQRQPKAGKGLPRPRVRRLSMWLRCTL